MKIPTRYSVRQVKEELWLRGDLSYKYHSGQIIINNKFLGIKRQLFFAELSRQFGKSVWAVTKALEGAFKRRNERVKYGTAFLTDLQEFILPAFDFILEDCPEWLRPVWKSQKGKFVLPHNGSEIKLVGLDRKPNGMRGNKTGLIILDEAGFISRLNYLYKDVIVPATTHRPDCKIIMTTTPPESPAHEVMNFVQKAEMEKAYLKLTVYDNPLLDAEDIKRLIHESGGEHTSTWRREYLCEHVVDENLAIIAGWKDCFEVDLPRDEYYKYYQRYVQMDMGVEDKTAILFGYYDFRRAKYIIEDEVVMSGSLMNTRLIQAFIKKKELELWRGIVLPLGEFHQVTDSLIKQVEQAWEVAAIPVFRRIADNNNPLMLQDLSLLHGLHFVPTDKGRLQEMVNAVKIMVQNGDLLVNPRCIHTKGCLKWGIWDKNRKSFARSIVYGHFDALAALIYGIRNLDRQTNPIPPLYGVDTMNQLVIQKGYSSPSQSALKNAFGFKKK